jgi:hypothetical protein
VTCRVRRINLCINEGIHRRIHSIIRAKDKITGVLTAIFDFVPITHHIIPCQ